MPRQVFWSFQVLQRHSLEFECFLQVTPYNAELLSVRRVAKRTGALFARLSNQTSQGECPAQCVCVPNKTDIIYRLLRSIKGKLDEPVGCRLRCRISFVAPLRRGFRVMRKEETLCIATSPRGTSHLHSRQTVTHSLCEASPSKYARY